MTTRLPADGEYSFFGTLEESSLIFHDKSTSGLTFTPAEDCHFSNGTGVVIGHTAQIATQGYKHELEILGTSATDGGIAIVLNADSSDAPQLIFAKSRSETIGSFTIVQDNDELGVIRFCPDDGTDFVNIAAQIRAQVDDGSPAANDVGGELLFFTHPGGGGALTQNFQIAGDGGIFCANLLAASASTAVNINGSGELHSVTSSAYYKDDIRDLDMGSRDILALKPRTFRFGEKKDAAPSGWPNSEAAADDDFGLIAEEVAEVYPELVSYRDGMPYSVKYSMLSVVLLQELQQLKVGRN